MSFHPAGTILLSLDQDAIIKVWKISTGALLHSVSDFGNDFQGIQFLNNGELAAWKGSVLWNIDPVTGYLLKNIDLKTANIKAVSHNGNLLAAADEKEMQLWDGTSGKPIASLVGEPEYLWGRYGDIACAMVFIRPASVLMTRRWWLRAVVGYGCGMCRKQNYQ